MFPARVLHLSNKSSVENSPSTLILKSSATVGSCSFSTSHKFWEVGFEKRFILSFTTLVNTKSIAERVGAWLCPRSGLVDPGFERPGEVDSGFCHRLSRHSNHDNKKEECYGLYCVHLSCHHIRQKLHPHSVSETPTTAACKRITYIINMSIIPVMILGIVFHGLLNNLEG